MQTLVFVSSTRSAPGERENASAVVLYLRLQALLYFSLRLIDDETG